MTTASEVAKYILGYFQSRGAPINNLKLQKLLYYCQAWHLAIHDTPLFDERIEAKIHGPAVPPIFAEYKIFGWSPILAATIANLSDSQIAHIDEVLSVYGNLSAWNLERLSHSESPWRDARAGLPPDAPSKNVIPCEAMKQFYRPRLHGQA